MADERAGEHTHRETAFLKIPEEYGDLTMDSTCFLIADVYSFFMTVELLIHHLDQAFFSGRREYFKAISWDESRQRASTFAGIYFREISLLFLSTERRDRTIQQIITSSPKLYTNVLSQYREHTKHTKIRVTPGPTSTAQQSVEGNRREPCDPAFISPPVSPELQNRIDKFRIEISSTFLIDKVPEHLARVLAAEASVAFSEDQILRALKDELMVFQRKPGRAYMLTTPPADTDLDEDRPPPAQTLLDINSDVDFALWDYCCTLHSDAAKQFQGPNYSSSEQDMGIYEKLVPLREFRTILLLPGGDGQAISCRLRTHLFAVPPSFHALSYEWGQRQSSPPKRITLNGREVEVTDNLWDALNQLRHPTKIIPLWVDAICINQRDTNERGVQVALMEDIYKCATGVISWTGLEIQDSVSRAIVWILEFWLYPVPSTTAPQSQDTPRKTDPVAQFQDLRKRAVQRYRLMDQKQTRTGHGRGKKSVETLGILEGQSRNEKELWRHGNQHVTFRDLADFFSISYWERLWIIQETELARKLRIQCGHVYIDWPVLKRFLDLLQLACRELPDPPRYISSLWQMLAAKILLLKMDSERPGGNRPSLASALFRFADAGCSDPRDRVYGLLGIADGHHGLFPDYRISLSELWGKLVTNPRMASYPEFVPGDHLVSFAQFLSINIGSSGASSEVPNLTPQRLLYTRGEICGHISVIGDAFSNVDDARKLLTLWHSLYFHNMKNNGSEPRLPRYLQGMVSLLAKDFRRAVFIDSRLSYGYIGVQRYTEKAADLAQILTRFSDGNCDAASSNITSKECDSSSPETGFCSCVKTTQTSHQPEFAIGTRGQIALVPGTSQMDDILIHFERSDVCVVVRPCEVGSKYFFVIGGAIVMKKWDEKAHHLHPYTSRPLRYSSGTPRRDSSESFDYDVDQMSVHLDVECLRLLTMRAEDLDRVQSQNVVPSGPPPTMEHLELVMERVKLQKGQVAPGRHFVEPA